MNKTIQQRESVLSFLKQKLGQDGMTTDSVQNAVSGIVESSIGLATLDAVISSKTEETLPSIVAKSISAFPNATLDSVQVALGVASQIAKKVSEDNPTMTLDSVENVAGGEVLGSLIALNIFSILSASIPFAGDIADLVPMSGVKDNVKFQLFTVNPTVKGGMGELEDGELLNAINAGKTMAFAERNDTQLFVTDTKSYSFDVKKKDADTDNYKIERGVNEVVINLDNGIFINDFDAQSMETTATRTVTYDGITYTVKFDYGAGTITLDLSDNIADGTKLFFSSSLSSEKLGEISGTVGSELLPTMYVAKPVVIGTKVNTLALRQVLQSTGLNLSSNDLMIALSKIAEEQKRKKVVYTLQFAKEFGETIDIVGASETTMADRYKHFLVSVEKAKADIVAKSQITSNCVIVGGSGLVEIFSALTTATNKTNIITDDNNSIRLIGELNDYECYYNPLHDEDYPAEDGVHKVFVVGNPADVTKRACISGVGLPVLPEDIGFDTEASDKLISLQGKIVISFNKDKHSRELVKELSVKLS